MARLAECWVRFARAFCGAAKRVIVPDLKHAQEWYYEQLNSVLQPRTHWLDLGCGHQILGDWMIEPERDLISRCDFVIGLDGKEDSVRQHRSIQRLVVGDGENLPFPDESFDVVTANMVCEHLQRPGVVMTEVRRILKPGGVFMVHTPNRRYYLIWLASKIPQRLKNAIIWHLERRREEDVFPTFYRFNTPAEIEKCAHESRFRVERLELVDSVTSLWRLGPVVVLELLLIRLFRYPQLRGLRSNIIVSLLKLA